MEENGADHEASTERASDFLVTSNNTEEVETGDQVFQHLAYVETGVPSFGPNASQAVLPITAPISEDASRSLNAQMQLAQTLPFSAEEFQLLHQSAHSLYEVQSSEGSTTHMMIVASQSENGQVLHVIPSAQPGMAQVIIPQGQLLDVSSSQDASEERNGGSLQTVAVSAIADGTSRYILHPQASLTVSKTTATRLLEDTFPVSPQTLSSNIPTWARRLRHCEKIGDSYRGYCSSETELESVLTVHKQQTHSVWGTRQSPSPAKPATRLMWKSQYVPFDGIPFVNAGSRAIVMECQYGPRRKGFQLRKTGEQENISCQVYRATCPARIYIKKVQKFPEYGVPTDPKIDKKFLRVEQEKAFNVLKKNLIDAGGVLRWYVQLPTQQAHQYHEIELCLPPSPYSMPSPEDEDAAAKDENCTLPSRLHPQVADKIRELVSQGIEQVYAVRKQLRKFVERELFRPDEVPEKHNLSFFPTVNDLKNHIHEVQKSLRNGKMLYNSETIPAMLQWTTDSGNILTETVTVTLASPTTEGSSPEKTTIKVESNGPRKLLTSESLQPRSFAQHKGLQLQSVDGTAALLMLESHPPLQPTSRSRSTGRQLTSQPVLCKDNNLQASFSQTQNSATTSVLGEQCGPKQRVVALDQFVTIGTMEDADAIETNQSLLGDGQTIPAQTADNCPAPGSKRYSKAQKTGYKNFHRVSVNIVLMIRVCRCFRRGLKGFSCFQLIEKDCRGEIEEDKKSASAVFDRHEFSVSKEHFPFRAIQITKKPPAWRTDSEIKHLQNRLQHLESFRQYSPTLQCLLAKVIRFERFGRRRVIIRKGHQADSFYFIYCGSVAITDDEDGGSAFVEAAPTTVRRGACFGEIALLQNTRRVATVVCMEETELLVVDKSDFFAYELDKELNREFKCRYEFLRSVELFETLPDSSVAKIANFCKIERSHYGQVITSDITDASTLIFITKGVCEVLRLVDLSTCPSYHKWISKQLCFPKRKLQIMEKRRLAAEIACVDRFKSTMWNSFSGERVNDLKEYYIHQRNEQYDKFMRQDSLFNRQHKSIVINVDTREKSKSSFHNKQHGDDDQEVVQNIISGVFRKEPVYSTSYGEMPASVAAAVYIRMDELRKGEMIANMQDSRVIVLVSQGAEIIRLKKERLEEWADAATMVKFSKIKMKYPSDDELCQVFLRQNSWESFKKDLLGVVMRPKLMKMVHPPHPCPTEEIYDSWCVNQAGILDLSKMRHQKELPPEKCKFVPVRVDHGKQSLPVIQPRLIHSITVQRSPLDGAF